MEELYIPSAVLLSMLGCAWLLTVQATSVNNFASKSSTLS